jgi:hypothetical protein
MVLNKIVRALYYRHLLKMSICVGVMGWWKKTFILKQYQNVGRRIGSMTGLGGRMIQYLFLGSMKWSLNFPDVTGTDYNKKGGIIIIIIF